MYPGWHTTTPWADEPLERGLLCCTESTHRLGKVQVEIQKSSSHVGTDTLRQETASLLPMAAD
eukprot:scaffold1626_cov178-Alexandrium_tamarense.AAC.9